MPRSANMAVPTDSGLTAGADQALSMKLSSPATATPVKPISVTFTASYSGRG